MASFARLTLKRATTIEKPYRLGNSISARVFRIAWASSAVILQKLFLPSGAYFLSKLLAL